MTVNEIFIYGWPLVVGILSWLVKTLFSTIKDKMETLEKNMEQLKQDISQVKIDYVHKTDFMAIRNEIIQRFDRFEDRLNNLKI